MSSVSPLPDDTTHGDRPVGTPLQSGPQPDSQRGPGAARVRSLARDLAERVVFWGAMAAILAIYLGAGDVVRAWLAAWRSQGAGVMEANLDGAGDAAWPHLRGPNYDGRAPNEELADAWPPEGPPALWSQWIGHGYSGSAIAGRRLFTQRQTLSGQSVLCLDAETGAVLWEHRYGWPYEAVSLYPGPRGTPTYCDGRVYYTSPEGRTGCLRADDGAPLWSRTLLEDLAGSGVEFGYAATPLVASGQVFLPVGGKSGSVVALDARSGSIVWSAGDEPASYCSAMPIELAGKRQIVVFLRNVLAGYDFDTGKPLWESPYSRHYDEHSAWPLYQEPHLLALTPFRAGCDLYRLDVAAAPPAGGELPKPKRIYHRREFSNDIASSVLVDGLVYGFDLQEAQTNRQRPSRGRFTCMEFATGQIRWTTDRVGHATVLAADGKLLLFTDRGELILARATGDAYVELARTPVFTGELCWTAPSLAEGRVYLRSPTRLACLYVGKPERLSAERLARSKPSSEVSPTEPIDWQWALGGQREFPYDAPDRDELLRWYVWSMATLLAAGVVAWAVSLLASRATRARRRLALFWIALFALGVATTPLGNRLSNAFVLTWPVCPFVLHSIALAAIVAGQKARQSPALEQRRARRRVQLSLALMLLGCIAYAEVCRHFGLSIAWAFLAAFLPCWPAAVPLAFRMRRGKFDLLDFALTCAAYTLYHAAAAGFILWHASRCVGA